MFFDCIKHQPASLLFDSNTLDRDPEYAFVGASTLCHPYCVNNNNQQEKETLFDIIYRHSFDRSRDIQQYGQVLTNALMAIKQQSTPHDREEKIKQIIEEKASRLAYCSDDSENSTNPSYYTEKLKYLPNYWAERTNFERLLTRIDRNLLFEDDVRRICREVNQHSACPHDGCESKLCRRHPFSMLFSMGYLGEIVSNSNVDVAISQCFKDARNITYFIERDYLLRESCENSRVVYVIHPALGKTIQRTFCKSMLKFTKFVIGKALPVDSELFDKMLLDKESMDKMKFESTYYCTNGLKAPKKSRPV